MRRPRLYELVTATLFVVGCGGELALPEATEVLREQACGRFTVLRVPGTTGGANERVRDEVTGLVWLRYSWEAPPNEAPWLSLAEASDRCFALGMRLPSLEEAHEIAGSARCKVAWPSFWGTWTSTVSEPGRHWYQHSEYAADSWFEGDLIWPPALCVRAP